MYEDAEKDGTVWNILDKDIKSTTTHYYTTFMFFFFFNFFRNKKCALEKFRLMILTNVEKVFLKD